MTEETRTIPALPGQVEGRAVREWTRWEPAPDCTHIDPSCEQCGHPGPLLLAFGVADERWETALPTAKREPGAQREWATVTQGWPVRSFAAFRCRSCDQMRIYRMSPWAEVMFRPPRTMPRGDGSQQGELFVVPPVRTRRRESLR